MIENNFVENDENNFFESEIAEVDRKMEYKYEKESYKNLKRFLRSFKIDKSSKNEYNIMDQLYGDKYHILDHKIPEFFELLEECHKDKKVLHLCESQKEPSCLMLDFDIEQIDQKSQFVQYDYYEPLIKKIMGLLKGILKINSDIELKVVITKKPTIVYKPEKKYYKDGFHMIISGIKIRKSLKKFIIKKIIEKGILTSVLSRIKVINENGINDILDVNSAHVPVLFIGSCKRNTKIVYNVEKIYQVFIKKDIPDVSVFKVNEDFWDNINIPYEFSLNFEDPNGSKKLVYFEKKEFIGDVDDIKNKISHDEDNKSNLSILRMTDPDAKEICDYINILDNNRWNNYNSWHRLIGFLAKYGDRYKPIAIDFMEKNPNPNSTKNGNRFEEEWRRALSSDYPYSIHLLKAYAKEDNPEEYELIKNKTVFAQARMWIFDICIQGRLEHYQMASLLFEMVGNKFIYRIDNKKWYEFIVPGDKLNPGELYKWRENKGKPFNLFDYMSLKLPEVFKNQLKFIDYLIEKSDNEDKIKYYNKMKQKITDFTYKLYQHGFKQNIIKECEARFRDYDVEDKMDNDKKYPNIFGVRQGLLEFKPDEKKECELINYTHDKYISRYSPVIYKRMDPENKIIQEVYKSIWDLFPEDEMDVFHYLLYFVSTSLTGRHKAATLVMLTGNGANGKSYLMELINNVLGSVFNKGYGTKLPISYLLENDQHSSNANPVLMSLKKARFAYFSESDKDEVLHPKKLKSLTAHEPITARALYGDYENFQPHAIYMLCTNYLFRIDSTDHGTWRRIKLYRMKIRFTRDYDEKKGNKFEKKMDPSFSGKKTSNQEWLSAFLSILVMYLTILDNKYDGDIDNIECPTIDNETEDYRTTQDTINQFINQKVIKTADEKEEYRFDVYNEYARWYNENVRSSSDFNKPSVIASFENSKIGKHIRKRGDNSIWIKGYRLEGDSPIEDNEKWVYQLNNKKNKTTNKNKKYLTSYQELKKMYNMYKQIIN